jgi:hypothetical protein
MSKLTWLALNFTFWTSGAVVALLAALGQLDVNVVTYFFVAWLPLALALFYFAAPRSVPHEFRPLSPDETPQAIRESWEDRTPDFVMLGFQPVGDYVLQTWPTMSAARYFLCADARIQGAIAVTPSMAISGVSTFFDDGRVIESAIHPHQESCCDEQDKIWINTLKNGSLFELLQLHEKLINAYEETSGAQAIDFTPDRIAELGWYAQRLVWWEWWWENLHLGRPVPPQRIATVDILAGQREAGVPVHV